MRFIISPAAVASVSMKWSAHLVPSTMRSGALWATLASLLAITADASAAIDQPQQVRDIRPGNLGSTPQGGVEFGRQLIFRAANTEVGDEPWSTDGTAAGTVPLEVSPGLGSSTPGAFTSVGDRVVFLAVGSGGDELWGTDGTQAGTAPVLDINPGPTSSNPRGFLDIGDQAVFRADDGVTGDEPWRTDGTAAGTSRVADINPGATGSAASFFFPARLGDSVLFRASEPVAGSELWRFPVAGGGAELVANINLAGGSAPLELTPVGNTLFFIADDGIVGRELWRSDGIPGGDYQLVDDFDNAATDSGVTGLTAFGSHVYMSVEGDGNGDELWRADASGAEIVRDINPIGDSNPQNLTPVGEWLYFTATNGSDGRELWRSDGVPGGITEMVADIDPAGSGMCGFPRLTPMGGEIYLCAENAAVGREVWRSDGTAAGTTPIDVNPGPGDSAPDALMVHDNETLYFAASDGSTGSELWAYDTAAPGTEVISGPDAGEHVATSRPALSINSRSLDLARYECSSGGPYVECAGLDGEGRSPALKDGEQTLSVRAVDVRENPDPTPEQLSFVVDTKGPKVAIKGKRASKRGGALQLKVKCKRSERSGPCRGKLVLKAAKGKGKVAKKKFRLKPGKAKRLKVKVRASKRPLLASRSVRAQGKVRDRLGNRGKVAKKKLRVR
jgi:ELWxxDGT repeat protein